MSYLKGRSAILKHRDLEVWFEEGWLGVYWRGKKLTTNAGLNLAINTAGLWADSSYGDWKVIKREPRSVVLHNIWKQLPLSCVWRFKLLDNHTLAWSVDMEIEEDLQIDERKVSIITSDSYKSWINSYEQGRFPRIIGWQDMPLEAASSRVVGVRFAEEAALIPLVLDFSDDQQGRVMPFIQNTSLDIAGRAIGVRMIDAKEKSLYAPGTYSFLSARIYLFPKEELLDKRIEMLRTSLLYNERRKAKLYRNRQPKALLVNLPWQNEGKWGVRAGSRWPHIKDVSEGNYLPFPFFLAYGAALLKQNNIDAELVDAIAEKIPEDEFIEKLTRKNFDILITETSVPSFYYDIDLLKRVSMLDVPVVLAGPHPAIYQPDFLEKHNFIDFVMFGEYEMTLLELVNAIRSGKKDLHHIAGLIWRDSKNNIIKNSPRHPFDINLLPWPLRQGLPLGKYWDLPGNIPYPSVQMVASRGCPFGCSFCLWPQLLFGGRTYRTRAVKDCIDEMQYLVEEKGFKSVYWDDDTFNIGKERMLSFCDEIVKRDLQKVPWAIMAKADLMDEEILTQMKQAGLYAVKYGVESASQELVDKCGKCLDLKKATRMIEFTKSLGIAVHLTFSFGLLGETKDTIRKTVDQALHFDPHSVQFSITTPFPGTRLFDELDKEGRIITKNWSLYDGHYSCVFKPDNMMASDLEEAKQYAYRMWGDHQRKKRGFSGEIKRFSQCCRSQGFRSAVRKTGSYLNYLAFHRKKFLGKI